MFSAWTEFKKGKGKKIDAQEFALNLEDNIFSLQYELADGSYRHSQYSSFYVYDPKLRHIHKACVRDRLLHQAVARVIEPIFERQFIFDSYSSRKDKGTHRAIARLAKFAWRLSQNNTKTVWALKCDIRKFFDSVDHNILECLISKKIDDKKLISLMQEVIRSYETCPGKGIPLGNLTSQLFSNIYLDELDQYVKRRMRTKYYVRYADDFVLLSQSKEELEKSLIELNIFLNLELKLELHQGKVFLRKFHQGVDFLGYVIYPHHKILRTKTKKRICRKIQLGRTEMRRGIIEPDKFKSSLQSFLGLLKHCRGEGIKRRMSEQ